MHCDAKGSAPRLTPPCCCVDRAPEAAISEAVRSPVSIEHPALMTAEPIVAIVSANDGEMELRLTDFGVDRSPPPSFQSPLRI